MDDHNQYILHAILALMDYHDTKGVELADYLGTTRALVSQWRSGPKKSYLRYLDSIASYYKISLTELMEIADADAAGKDMRIAIDEIETRRALGITKEGAEEALRKSDERLKDDYAVVDGKLYDIRGSAEDRKKLQEILEQYL